MVVGCNLCGRVVDDGFGQLHDHDHSNACAGHDYVSPTVDDLGDVGDLEHVGVADEAVKETGDDQRVFEVVDLFQQRRRKLAASR